LKCERHWENIAADYGVPAAKNYHWGGNVVLASHPYKELLSRILPRSLNDDLTSRL